ncbi:MAG: hypothetical protein WCP20_04790 [Desulfuromonadales bacterium]
MADTPPVVTPAGITLVAVILPRMATTRHPEVTPVIILGDHRHIRILGRHDIHRPLELNIPVAPTSLVMPRLNGVKLQNDSFYVSRVYHEHLPEHT